MSNKEAIRSQILKSIMENQLYLKFSHILKYIVGVFRHHSRIVRILLVRKYFFNFINFSSIPHSLLCRDLGPFARLFRCDRRVVIVRVVLTVKSNHVLDFFSGDNETDFFRSNVHVHLDTLFHLHLIRDIFMNRLRRAGGND